MRLTLQPTASYSASENARTFERSTVTLNPEKHRRRDGWERKSESHQSILSSSQKEEGRVPSQLTVLDQNRSVRWNQGRTAVQCELSTPRSLGLNLCSEPDVPAGLHLTPVMQASRRWDGWGECEPMQKDEERKMPPDTTGLKLPCRMEATEGKRGREGRTEGCILGTAGIAPEVCN